MVPCPPTLHYTPSLPPVAGGAPPPPMPSPTPYAAWLPSLATPLDYNPPTLSDINARALRSGGTMALLCARVDPNIIQMVGRWHSDAMFHYLHLQATPLIGDLSHRMLTGSAFTLLPDQDLPAPATAMLLQVPPPVAPDF